MHACRAAEPAACAAAHRTLVEPHGLAAAPEAGCSEPARCSPGLRCMHVFVDKTVGPRSICASAGAPFVMLHVPTQLQGMQGQAKESLTKTMLLPLFACKTGV
jgi:hypothetical protein